MITTDRMDIIPENWYNVIPDLPEPLPPPRDNRADFSSIDLLNKIIPKEILRQEFTVRRYETIPEEVAEAYRQIGRPTPLIRAKNMEKALGFAGHIFLKFEGATFTGSHKINTALPQAYYARLEGSEEVVTETGAGQWGTATALASSLYDLKSKVFMVRTSYDQKPLRKQIMMLYGSQVYASPSNETEFGRRMLSENPDHPGTLGMAISEAVEYALKHDARYMLGSVMNSVVTHQSIIGLETKKQLEIIGDYPDALIGCVGGGSNFSGFAFPFIPDGKEIDYIASTAREVPKFTQGEYRYDLIDTAGILPSLRMYSLGANFVPEKIYAGGLRYHGAAPSLSLLVNRGTVRAEDISQEEVINALKFFANRQGIVAAPESGHAIASAIRYVKEHLNEKRTVVISVSGHGLMDMKIFDGVL